MFTKGMYGSILCVCMHGGVSVCMCVLMDNFPECNANTIHHGGVWRYTNAVICVFDLVWHYNGIHNAWSMLTVVFFSEKPQKNGSCEWITSSKCSLVYTNHLTILVVIFCVFCIFLYIVSKQTVSSKMCTCRYSRSSSERYWFWHTYWILCAHYTKLLAGWISSRCSNINGDSNESFTSMFNLLWLITRHS